MPLGLPATHDLRRNSSSTPTVPFALAHQDTRSTSKVSHSHPPSTFSRCSALTTPSHPRPLQPGALSSDTAGPSPSLTQTHILTLSRSSATTAAPAVSPSNSSTTPRLLVAPPGPPKPST